MKVGRKMIQDEFTPVRSLGGNRYELKDGRIVSRQRVEQMRHPERNAARNKRLYHAKTGSEKYYKKRVDAKY